MRLIGPDDDRGRPGEDVAGGGGARGFPPTSALRTHVSYIGGSTATAVIRPATVEDSLSVARLMISEAAGGAVRDKRQQRAPIRTMLTALRDRRTIIHVVELKGRLCSAVRLRPVRQSRIFASEAIVGAAGRAFDPVLMLRMMEHAVQCCLTDGWAHLRYLADLPSPRVVEAYFRRLGYDCEVGEARIGLSERLRFGRRSHEIHFTFAKDKRGPDFSDPRIVWF